MCTLTAFQVKKDFLICMNRDESVSRQESGLSFINESPAQVFPTDSVSKGTWFGANQTGITLALLNRYHESNLITPDEEKISRGTIIPNGLKLTKYSEIIAYIEQLDFIKFAPFDLLVFSTDESCQFSWNGNNLSQQIINPKQGVMRTSSSVDTSKVIEYRNQLFQNWLKEQPEFPENLPNNILKDFHLQQDVNNTSWSVLMNRELTHTKSISQVEIDYSGTQLKYYDQDTLLSIAQNHSLIESDYETITL